MSSTPYSQMEMLASLLTPPPSENDTNNDGNKSSAASARSGHNTNNYHHHQQPSNYRSVAASAAAMTPASLVSGNETLNNDNSPANGLDEEQDNSATSTTTGKKPSVPKSIRHKVVTAQEHKQKQLQQQQQQNNEKTSSSSSRTATSTSSKQIWDPEQEDIPQETEIYYNPNETREIPEYEISYRQQVGTEHVYMGMDSSRIHPGSTGSTHLLIQIELPKCRSISDMTLDVKARKLKLTTPETYYLNMALPHVVDSDRGEAKWLKEKKVLRILLPLDKDAVDL